MQVLKSGKYVTGANFTNAEKKALDIEVRRMIREHLDKVTPEINAAVLWRLHKGYGFGPERLKEFYKDFRKDTTDMLDHYEMSEGDAGFINIHALKEYGIDIYAWEKEFKDGGME